ncbi:MAG: S8 family serine peptidase [Lachnospiraceae bacterium]|nr:S8 family serine peptidase [Lachnospiraceae bacterium]
MQKIIRKAALLIGISLLLAGDSFIAEANQNFVINVPAEHRAHQRKMGRKSRERIHLALEGCSNDGAESAKCLNQIRNQREFEIGVRKVLNKYYSMDKSQRGELEAFVKELDDSASEIVEHYEEAAQERENGEKLSYQAGEVMVTFSYGTSKEKIEKVIQETAASYEVVDCGDIHIDDALPDYKKKRLEKIKDYKTDIVVLAKINLEDTVKRAEEKFINYDCVIDVSENTFLEADGTIGSFSGSVTSDDPLFNENDQWNMRNIDIAGAHQKLKRAHSVTEIWVAVIDCGVQINHPDLKNKILTKYSVDVTQNNKKLADCPDKRSRYGQYTGNHGTMIAGVIAAEANNGIFGAGVTSIAGDTSEREVCKIMAIKCDNTVGSGKHITKSFLASAVNYAVNHGAEVINISYSAQKNRYRPADFKNLENAIKRAVAAGVCVVASAGNDGTERLRYPAAFDGVIGVGATLSNNAMASYSNQSSAVDIVAPGGGQGMKKICSVRPVSRHRRRGYGYGRGTSYSAPQVAGTVAMMKSINYNLTPDQILSKLKKSSTVVVRGKVNPSHRFHLLNAGRAVSITRQR